MAKPFLHDNKEFPALMETVAEALHLNEPALVEKDYWIMHVLWGLQQQDFRFELKGGTSLSKGHGIIHRFSEDIDIQIHPPRDQHVPTGKNQNKPRHVEARNAYYAWLAEKISMPGIQRVVRDTAYDDEKKRNGGLRLEYRTQFNSVEGIKDGILLEVGFDQTTPNTKLDISSWSYDHAAQHSIELRDNRATGVPCYNPEYTFVEKLQTVVSKFRKLHENPEAMPANFLRHYYDIHQLLGNEDVREFIGTNEYKEHKARRFGARDKDFGIAPAFDILHPRFQDEYQRTNPLYYREQVSLSKIVQRIRPFFDRL